MATIALRHHLKARAANFLQGAALYLVCFAILCSLIFSTPAFLSTDDYYHTQMALQLVKQGRLNIDFPWLPLTILSPSQFADHHLFFHILIAPAVVFFGMTGA